MCIRDSLPVVHVDGDEQHGRAAAFPGAHAADFQLQDVYKRQLQAVAACTPGGASVSFMDLSIEAEAFGANIRFSEDEVPTVVAVSYTHLAGNPQCPLIRK